MAIFTLLVLVYTTRCCSGWFADRVVRRGSSCLIGSTRGRFALSSCSHISPSLSDRWARQKTSFTEVSDEVFAPTDYNDDLEVLALGLYPWLLQHIIRQYYDSMLHIQED